MQSISFYFLEVAVSTDSLADRNAGQPDWRFAEEEKEENKDPAREFISEKLLDLHVWNPGMVSDRMREECLRHSNY